MTLATPPLRHALPAGGSDPDRFDWAEAWLPVHYVEDLDRQRPTRFTLLGRDVVIWWDRQGETWRVFWDQCPHRLAPLSEGRINDEGHLECPYHGWAFDGEGVCTALPQGDAEGRARQSTRACAHALPTAVRQGLLFVYPGNQDRAPHVDVPMIDPLEAEPEGWVVLNTFRDLPYDALTLLENVLDVSHIPFTHHKTVGRRENAAPITLEVTDSGRWGFKGLWPEGPRKGKLGTQTTRFVAPGLMYHDLTSQQFGRTLTVVYATPMDKGRCRLFARFPFKFSSPLPRFLIQRTPRWLSHQGNNRVLEDDQIFLHLQERALAAAGDRPYAQACYLPTAADRYVSAFRQWVQRYQADPFPSLPLPPAQSLETLLDRYESHTRHCGSCHTALERMQQLRGLALAIAAIAAFTGPLGVSLSWPWAGILGLGIVGIGALSLWGGVGVVVKRFYLGSAIPPRNLD